MLRRLSNYYIVLKLCWVILLFIGIGYFAFLTFQQGQDILRFIDLSATDSLAVQHAWLFYFAVMWWGWQSWRSSRLILHFKGIHFWTSHPQYGFRSQVLIPRLLGIVPLLISGWAVYQANGAFGPLSVLLWSSAFWLFVFFVYRKDLVTYLRSKFKFTDPFIPDYVISKDPAYPVKFVWSKQWKWIMFRLLAVSVFCFGVIFNPVPFTQFMGASALVASALGSWLIVGSLVTLMEEHIQFPLSFSFVLMVLVFSYFNNNHKLHTIKPIAMERPSVETYFESWADQRLKTRKDTLNVYLVAAEGGGIRSAYWTAQVLANLKEQLRGFEENTFALSGVSGGSLGIGSYQAALKVDDQSASDLTRNLLKQDFLSPVTGFLVYPELIQKFIPFAVESFDRASTLEASWEQGWAKTIGDAENAFEKGMIDGMGLHLNQPSKPVLLFNATKSENGYRVIASNAKLCHSFKYAEDLLNITRADISLSKCISIGARFPILTPPALVKDQSGKDWGNVVDGGYFENMGATTLMDVYDVVSKVAQEKEYPIRFHMIFIKNTSTQERKPLNGMYELGAPLSAITNVWVNNGDLTVQNVSRFALQPQDQILHIQLDRNPSEIIPLGWYLSPNAARAIDIQVPEKVDSICEVLR